MHMTLFFFNLGRSQNNLIKLKCCNIFTNFIYLLSVSKAFNRCVFIEYEHAWICTYIVFGIY